MLSTDYCNGKISLKSKPNIWIFDANSIPFIDLLVFTPNIANGGIFALLPNNLEMAKDCDSGSGFLVNLFIRVTTNITLCNKFHTWCA